MHRYAPLPERSLITITGPDARAFLQGVVTVDALKLMPGQARYGALLSPQGKFLHDFFLIADGERLLLDVDGSRSADLLARLALYRLRAKAELARLPEWGAYALWGNMVPGIPPEGLLLPDARYAPLGWRLYGPPAACEAWLAAQSAESGDYDTHRLSLAVPDAVRDMVADRSLILECGFEQLHGVDFNKGCYVGQEVTARTKFRATLRKQFYLVRATHPLPPPGTAIEAQGREVGELRSVRGTLGLALLNTEAAAGALSAAGIALHAETPPWVTAFGKESTGEI